MEKEILSRLNVGGVKSSENKTLMKKREIDYFHQIVQLEHEEDELRNLKKRREQSLENFIEQFRNISINAEQKIISKSTKPKIHPRNERARTES